MTRDILISRRCMVGPDGYFRPGADPDEDGSIVDGAVIVSVDFFRPEPDADEDPTLCPMDRCEYEITYGDEVIHAYSACGMDGIGALLRAMVDAARHFDGYYFNAIDESRKYSDVIPYIGAIPKEWLDDMRIAGVEPTWIANESVIFQHADGRRLPGRIALGCPIDGYDQHKPHCNASLTGLEDRYAWHEDGETTFQALQLAMASLAGRLRAFIANGGRVLKPDGGGDVNLEALFGPLLADRPMTTTETAP